MAITYNTSIVRSGLVLHLDAANPKSYPGTGTVWKDLSGNGGDHNLYNGASLTTVDGVKCIDTTSNKYVANPSSAFTFPSQHTLISWARPLADSQTSTWRTLWRTTPNDHPILIQDGTNLIGFYDNNGGNFQSYGINVGTIGIENKWSMFTLVSDGSMTTLYINNGIISGSVNYTTSGNLQDAIGNTDGGSQPFGYVSIASIYNRALTLAEIQQNFEAVRGRYGI